MKALIFGLICAPFILSAQVETDSVNTVPSDQKVGTYGTGEGQQVDLSELKQRLKSIDEKLEDREPVKFFLDPTKFFGGFSLGANFDFLDGFNDNTLFSDLEINTGVLVGKINFQFGVNRGRTKQLNKEYELTNFYSHIYPNPNAPGEDFEAIFLATKRYKTDIVSDRSNIYVRFNHETISRDHFKLFTSLQYEYLALSQNQVFRSSFIVKDTSQQRPAGSVILPYTNFRSDTTRRTSYFNYFYPSVGITLFTFSDDVDFTLTNTIGFLRLDNPTYFEKKNGFTFIV